MNGFKLYRQTDEGYKPVGLWCCDCCGRLHSEQSYADQCCIPRLCKCGKPTDNQYIGQCCDCRDRAFQEKCALESRQRIDKSERCDPDLNTSGVWYDDDSDTYHYDGLGDAVHYNFEYGSGSGDPPEVLYFCHQHGLKLDAASILQNAEENAGIEDSNWRLDGESLQKVLDAWVAEHASHIGWYTPDYRRSVDTAAFLDPDVVEALKKEIDP